MQLRQFHADLSVQRAECGRVAADERRFIKVTLLPAIGQIESIEFRNGIVRHRKIKFYFRRVELGEHRNILVGNIIVCNITGSNKSHRQCVFQPQTGTDGIHFVAAVRVYAEGIPVRLAQGKGILDQHCER